MELMFVFFTPQSATIVKQKTASGVFCLGLLGPYYRTYTQSQIQFWSCLYCAMNYTLIDFKGKKVAFRFVWNTNMAVTSGHIVLYFDSFETNYDFLKLKNDIF